MGISFGYQGLVIKGYLSPLSVPFLFSRVPWVVCKSFCFLTGRASVVGVSTSFHPLTPLSNP